MLSKRPPSISQPERFSIQLSTRPPAILCLVAAWALSLLSLGCAHNPSRIEPNGRKEEHLYGVNGHPLYNANQAIWHLGLPVGPGVYPAPVELPDSLTIGASPYSTYANMSIGEEEAALHYIRMAMSVRQAHPNLAQTVDLSYKDYVASLSPDQRSLAATVAFGADVMVVVMRALSEDAEGHPASNRELDALRNATPIRQESR